MQRYNKINHLSLKYDDVLVIDETTVEVRSASFKNWRKQQNGLSRAVGGKIGKPKKSNVAIDLLGGISRTGLSPLVFFIGKFQNSGPNFKIRLINSKFFDYGLIFSNPI